MPALSRLSKRLLLSAALAAATALSGCFGGDDDDPPAPATAAATADTTTATWNGDSTLDVLANDSVSQGDKRLLALVRAPANGSARIADGRIVYRPRDGFFGADTLRYSLGTSAGTATAEAEVSVTVEAVLALNGLAIDAPLAQAAVQISGAASAAATTDAQGAWQARVRVSDPQGVVQISAAGSGAQAHVRLVGAAAAGDLAAAAGPDGTVVAEQVGALTVSHFSTALAALAERAHGRVPGTAAALAEARAQVDGDALVDLATLIHLAADEGLALPAGKADTWALAQDATAVAALLAQLATSDGAVFEAARQRALGAAPAAGPLPTAGTLVAYASGSFGPVTVITLADDGTGQVSEYRGGRSARWTQDSTGLTITLDAPLSATTFENAIEPVSNLQVALRRDVTAMRLRRLAGGLVALQLAETETRVDGARAGETRTLRTLADPGTAWRLAVNPLDAAPLAVADFEPGKRWAGIRQMRFNAEPLPLDGAVNYADILEMTAAGSGRALRTGTTYTVEVSGAAFTLTGSDGSRLEYLRIGEAGAGAWHFAVTDRSSNDGRTFGTVLVPPATSLVWDAAGASRAWLLAGSAGFNNLPIALRPDGTGNYIGQPATWQVMPDGRLRIVRPRANGRQTRADWIPLARGSDGSVWVLRTLFNEPAAALQVDDSTPMWHLIRYMDSGPGS